jgi:YD repeat-containing protein
MKTIRRMFIFCLLTIIFSTNSFSQKIPVANPSPEAAGLGIVGNIPVSFHTGRVDISVPLIEIQENNYSVPIALSYNSAGMLPDLRPGWVGQNWTLDVGGIITRSIKGLPDEIEDYGFSYSYNRLNITNWASDSSLLKTTSSAYYLNEVVQNINYYDTEPDEFFFRVNGLSGKFYIGLDGKFKLVSEPGVKVESTSKKIGTSGPHPSIPTFEGFKIIAQDGTIYHFGFDNNLIETTSTGIDNYSGAKSVATSWHLAKIELPNSNEKILFNYSTQKNDINKSTMTVDVGSAWIWKNNYWVKGSVSGNCSEIWNKTLLSYIDHRYLQSIEGTDFILTFFTSNTGDKKHSSEPYPNWQKLDSIALKNKSNEKVKSIKFTYYTGTNTRLYLKSVTESGKPPYEFKYDGGQSIDYDKPAVDHWGYYNGYKYNNSGFISRISYIINLQGDSSEYYNINRETDPLYVTAGILNQITYPTGGTVNFEFEANDYSKYSYAKNGNLNLKDVQKSWSNWKYIEGTSLTVQNAAYYSMHLITYVGGEANEYEINGSLNAGTYSISYFFQKEGIDFNLNGSYFICNYRELTSSSNAYCGGTRIKKVTYKEGETEIIKEYKYVKNYTMENTSSVSSGILGSLPIYNYSIDVSKPPIPDSYDGYYDAYVSQPVSPISLSEGSHIGYSEVIEITKDKNGNSMGYTRYKYTNFDSNPDSLPVNTIAIFARDYGARNKKDNERGKLLSKTIFSKNEKKQKETIYEYNRIIKDGLRAIENRCIYIASCIMPNAIGYVATAYYINNNSYLMAKETEISYDINGANPVTVVTNYQYDSRNQLTTKETTGSDKITLKTELKYPYNFTETVYNSMVSNNILSPIIEQLEYKNNVFLMKNRIEYKDWGGGIFAPQYIKFQTKDAALETRLTYHNYDAHGNPLYISKDDEAEKTVYLWSYNYLYLIAEIKNATYSEVKTALNFNDTQMNTLAAQSNPDVASIDSKLRTYFNNKTALVTTYTYKPLVGILTSTDQNGMETKYKYDAFGRLTEVMHHWRTIEEYQYNYKN